MDTNNEMGSAQPNDAVSGGQGGESQDAGSAGLEQQQSGRGESRLLGEVKSLKQKLADAQSQIEASQLKALEAEGNKDKQIEYLSGRVQTLESSLKQKEKAFGFATLGSQVKTEAAKMGVQNPDDLIKLMDLSSIPVDPDNYTGDTDSIRIMLEEQKKSRPFFFAKPAPTVHDVAQQNTIVNKPQKDFSEMSREELDAHIKAMADQKIV